MDDRTARTRLILYVCPAQRKNWEISNEIPSPAFPISVPTALGTSRSPWELWAGLPALSTWVLMLCIFLK